MIITIDGPSGTGKSTTARLLAKRLCFSFFDTGALYRSVAWWMLEEKWNLEEVSEKLDGFFFRIEENKGEKRYFVNEAEVTHQIRTAKITELASTIAALAKVRAALLSIQRQYAREHDSVFEGRDLGTVVFPQAEVKIFLTASAEVRGKRRYAEMVSKGLAQGMTREEVMMNLQKRDEQDSRREIAPLKCPEDAFILDTSNLNVDQVLEILFNHILTKKKDAGLA